MTVKLTQTAFTQLKKLRDLLQKDFPRPIIPCLGWHFDEFYLDGGGGRIHSGPGFGVGCFFTDGDHGTWKHVEQSGLEFLLLLPPDLDNKNDVIDFKSGKFVFL